MGKVVVTKDYRVSSNLTALKTFLHNIGINALHLAGILSTALNIYFFLLSSPTMSDKKLTPEEIEKIKKTRQKVVSGAVIVTKDANT